MIALATAPQAALTVLMVAACLIFAGRAVFSRTYQNRNNPR